MSAASQAALSANNASFEAHFSWAQEELGETKLPDKRLLKRLLMIVASFFAAPQWSIPRSSGSWAAAKGAYRFFDNKNVDPDEIINGHRDSVLQRCRDEDVLLVLADTTQIDHTDHPATKGLGPLTNLDHRGMNLHPSLVATPKGTPMGVIGAQMWVRDVEGFGHSSETTKKRKVEDKESRKWLASMDDAERFVIDLGTATLVVTVMDREGDTWDTLEKACQPGRQSHLLVRAQADRLLQHPQQKIWEELEQRPVVATRTIEVPPATPEREKGKKKKKGKKTGPAQMKRREGRQAVLSIRFATITVMPPVNRPKSAGHQPVTINAVYINEDSPPEGEEPISWMLLTTVPVESADDACKIVEWYTRRWLIELLFKVLKTGCEAEERQLETAERLKRCLAVDMVVAWRILYLTMVGRETPDLPCSVIFEDYEWKALYAFVHRSLDKIPETEPTLGEVTKLIGRLGGHLGRKQDGDPGILTMWRGLQRLPDIAAMWRVFNRKESG